MVIAVERRPHALLRALVDLRDRQIQKARIQFGNRVSAIIRAADQADSYQLAITQRYSQAFSDLEKQLDRDIKQLVEYYPIYEHLSSIRGIGPLMAAKIIALIGDIGQFDTVSKLWRFAGYAVVDGQREYRKPGEKSHYSVRLKTALYLVGTSFLRSDSPYRAIYDRAYQYYLHNRPEWVTCATCGTLARDCREPERHSVERSAKGGWRTGHVSQAALRKMIKVFLAHLWERWRLLEGLPVRQPYVHEYLGHTTVERPEDYGWPPL